MILKENKNYHLEVLKSGRENSKLKKKKDKTVLDIVAKRRIVLLKVAVEVVVERKGYKKGIQRDRIFLTHLNQSSLLNRGFVHYTNKESASQKLQGRVWING